MEPRQGAGIGRSLLIGSLMGLVAVAALAGWALWSGVVELSAPDGSDVVVILVLPDEEGVVLPRVIDRYSADTGSEAADASVTAESVDPLLQTEIPGTSYTELREAYPFSGAAGVAKALAQGEDEPPAYILISPEALTELMGSDSIEIDIPSRMEVFDGSRLFTFEPGIADLEPDEVVALFKGADYLDDGDREAIREQVGSEVLRLLDQGSDDTGAPEIVETDLEPDAYARWIFAVLR